MKKEKKNRSHNINYADFWAGVLSIILLLRFFPFLCCLECFFCGNPHSKNPLLSDKFAGLAFLILSHFTLVMGGFLFYALGTKYIHSPIQLSKYAEEQLF
jgi:hypothetical protein